MSEWISVDDQLPENYQEVLVIVTGRWKPGYEQKTDISKVRLYSIGWMIGGKLEDCYSPANKEVERVVTHWMPLPEPPK